jgi:type III pantothenate kinase
MKKLILDFGNTLNKIAVFKENNIIQKDIFPRADIENTLNTIKKSIETHHISHAILSDVGETHLIDELESLNIELVILTHRINLPINIEYQSPETLGKDRIALASGVYSLNPAKKNLVIDMGTAITIDYIDKEGNYLGGSISPGMNMRFNALNHYTSRLPLTEPQSNIPLTGINTHLSIISGIQNGIVFELDGFINAYKEIYGDVDVFLSGGDVNYFDKKLKNTIFVDRNLLLKGLNRILDHNV